VTCSINRYALELWKAAELRVYERDVIGHMLGRERCSALEHCRIVCSDVFHGRYASAVRARDIRIELEHPCRADIRVCVLHADPCLLLHVWIDLRELVLHALLELAGIPLAQS